MCAKTYQKLARFDEVIRKIIWCSFLSRMVFYTDSLRLQSYRTYRHNSVVYMQLNHTKQTVTYFICFTMVLFPHSPPPAWQDQTQPSVVEMMHVNCQLITFKHRRENYSWNIKTFKTLKFLGHAIWHRPKIWYFVKLKSKLTCGLLLFDVGTL